MLSWHQSDQIKKGTFLSQRKYTLNLLWDSGILGCSPYKTLIDPFHRFQENEGDMLINVGQYQRLVGKLIYLFQTRPNISYVVGVVTCQSIYPCSNYKTF